MKKTLSMVLLLVLILSIGTGSNLSFADTNQTKVSPRGTYWEYWEVEEVYENYDTQPLGEFELCYVGEPADRDGMTQTAIASLSVDASVGGSIKVPISVIEANINFSIGTSYTAGGSTTSDPLSIGEYIKGYARPIANVTKLVQRKYIHMDGQDYPTSTTANAYTYKPTAVNIDVEYFSSSKSGTTTEPYRVESFIIDVE